jgi:hypothetical protein
MLSRMNRHTSHVAESDCCPLFRTRVVPPVKCPASVQAACRQGYHLFSPPQCPPAPPPLPLPQSLRCGPALPPPLPLPSPLLRFPQCAPAMPLLWPLRYLQLQSPQPSPRSGQAPCPPRYATSTDDACDAMSNHKREYQLIKAACHVSPRRPQPHHPPRSLRSDQPACLPKHPPCHLQRDPRRVRPRYLNSCPVTGRVL